MKRAPRLDSEIVSKLSELNPVIPTLALAFDWFLIFGAIFLTELYFSWPLYIVTVLFLGGRYHALGILMHESAHNRFFKNKKLNDWVGEVFGAWPLLVTVYGYRKNHLTHHNKTNTEKDPDWARKVDDPYFALPKSKKELLIDLLKAISGFRFFIEVRNVAKSKDLKAIPKSLKIARLLFYISVIALCGFFGVLSQLALYWLVPIITSLSFVLYVRSVSEHHGGTMNYEDELGATRHIDANWFERLFIPHNINYHIAHHLYPSVPYYNLPELHKNLLELDEYRSRAHITNGYMTGVFRECIQS